LKRKKKSKVETLEEKVRKSVIIGMKE